MNKDLFIKIFPTVLVSFFSLLSFIIRKLIINKNSRGLRVIETIDKYLLDFVLITEKYVGKGGGKFKRELVIDMLVNKLNTLGIKVVDKDFETIYNRIDNIISKINEFNKK